MKAKQKSAKNTIATKKRFEGFTDEEKNAMMERVSAIRAKARRRIQGIVRWTATHNDAGNARDIPS